MTEKKLGRGNFVLKLEVVLNLTMDGYDEENQLQKIADLTSSMVNMQYVLQKVL